MMKLFRPLEKIRIRSFKRHVPFITNYPGFACSVTDKSSFLSMYQEIFEREIYKFTSTNFSPRIIDCGANIGLSSIYFKKIFPNAEIIAFEPDPYIFTALKANISSAEISDVKLINKGVWSSDTEMSFFSEGGDGGRIATKHDDQNIITVRMTKLSPYLTDPIDLLKIDIEGAELVVLKECEHALDKVGRLFVEYHAMEESGQELGEILTILKNSGFSYYVESTGVQSEQPFTLLKTHLGYTNQLNIFAYRR